MKWGLYAYSATRFSCSRLASTLSLGCSSLAAAKIVEEMLELAAIPHLTQNQKKTFRNIAA